MKIARPSKPEAPFKRKRSPPPQATKLLRYSMLSGVVFMVLLAIVFLPRMFPNQSPVEIINPSPDPTVNGKLRFDTSNGTRLYVDATSDSLELAKFRANLTLNRTRAIGNLGPGLGGGNATLYFMDSNGNGLLDAGDYFGVSPPPNGCYRVEVFQVDADQLAGYQEWGACT